MSNILGVIVFSQGLKQGRKEASNWTKQHHK